MHATASRPSASRRAPVTRALAWVSLALAGVVGAALLWHTTGDLDLLLHDRTGRDILAGDGIPRLNGYSFTAPEHPWLDHEWAFQVLVAAVGDLGGQDSVTARETAWRWLRLALGLTLIGALVSDLTRHRQAPAAWLGAILLAALAMLWTRLTLRPELISYALLALLLGRIEASFRDTSDEALWRRLLDPRRAGGQATLITLAWSQFHGFAALAPVLWLLAGLLDRGPLPVAARWRRCLAGVVFALLANAATPNGPAALLYPLRVLAQFGADRPDLGATIAELVPLLDTRGSLAATLVVFKVSLIWGAIWVVLGWPRRSWTRIAIWLLAIGAAWQGQRNLGLYAVAFVLLHGGPITAGDDLGSRLIRRWAPRGSDRRAHVAVTAVATAGLATVALLWLGGIATDRFYLREGVARRFGPGLTPANYPLAVASDLAGRPVRRVANTVDAASSIIWYDAGRVAIDGRTEAYPPEVWRDYRGFRAGGSTAIALLDRWQADAVCLAHRNPASHAVLQTLRSSQAWRLAAADAAGVTYLRARVAAPSESAPQERLRTGARSTLARLTTTTPTRDVRLADQAAAWASLLVLHDDHALARDLLERAARACPGHPVVRHNLGNVLLAQGEFASALPHFEAAARLNRNAAPPLVNAGNCLFRLGRIEEAAVAFASAVARDGANFEGWANLAEVRRRLGDRAGAGEAYRRALSLRPDDRRLRERARTL
jgi:tetratricopeptide (TPR) repeat protein